MMKISVRKAGAIADHPRPPRLPRRLSRNDRAGAAVARSPGPTTDPARYGRRTGNALAAQTRHVT